LPVQPRSEERPGEAYPRNKLYYYESKSSSSNQVFASPLSDREKHHQADNFILGVSIFKHITYSEEFVNVFVRIGFDSSIELVSFDEIQVVTFNSEFVCGFRNGNCRTESQSNNTVGSPHGFIIHRIDILKGNEKVTEVIDIENWRIDNSRILRRIISLFDWNPSVSSMKSLIQSTFRFRVDFVVLDFFFPLVSLRGAPEASGLYDLDVHNLKSVETEFLAIVRNDALTSKVTLSCEPTVSPFSDNEIDFRISFDEFEDEDYTVTMDDPNITMEEYIRLEEEKARRRGKVYN
nr:hypothetical protein [Tanacetum cinerariifolium]